MKKILFILLTSLPFSFLAQERLAKLNLNVLKKPTGTAALVLSASSNDPLGFASSLQNSFNAQGFFLPVGGIDTKPYESVIAKYRGEEMLLLTCSYNYRADTGCGGSVPSKLTGSVLYFGPKNEPMSCANFSFSQGGFEGKCMSRVTDDLARRLIQQFGPTVDIQLNGPAPLLGKVQNRNLDEDSLRAAIRSGDLDPIQGVYKSMIGGDDRCGTYRIGIIKEGYGYEIINLKQTGNWDVGEVKAELEETAASGIYSGIWNSSLKNPIDCMFSLKGGLLEILMSEDKTCNYVKLWPKSDLKEEVSESENDARVVSTGSAVVVDASLGLCVTNAHVVDENKSVFVKIQGEELKCSVLQVDNNNDLALIKILDVSKSNIEALPISMSPKVGMKVYSAGYPKMGVMGESMKVTEGVISSLSFLNDPSKFQISCPITNGNSGGALLDQNGNLVGITQGGYRPDMATENVNAAVKALFVINIAQVVPESQLTITPSQEPVDFDFMPKSVLPVLIRD